MNRPLEQTVAMVTGASSGIGEASALALAKAGAALALVARREARLQSLAKRIEEDGGRALVICADITAEAQAREAVERAAKHFGRLDTLVNNAGVMLLGPIAGANLEEWRRMMDLNVMGLLYSTHAAVPHLLEAAQQDPRRVADIVNVSSVAGRLVRLGSGVYNATKHAVGAFSESLRQELSARHVRVSLVEPGATDTELRSHNRPEVLSALMARLGDIKRLESEEIADAVCYLVTRERHVAINEILIRPTQQAT